MELDEFTSPDGGRVSWQEDTLTFREAGHDTVLNAVEKIKLHRKVYSKGRTVRRLITRGCPLAGLSHYLCLFLGTIPELEEVDIKGSELTAREFSSLMGALALRASLVRVSIVENTNSQSTYIDSWYFTSMRSLSTLVLRESKFTPVCIGTCIDYTFQHCGDTLRVVDLSGNPLGPFPVELAARHLPLLEKLALSDTSLGVVDCGLHAPRGDTIPEQARNAIAKLYTRSKYLEELDLSLNKSLSGDILMPFRCPAKRMNFAECELTRSDGEILINRLSMTPTITRLVLDRNNLGPNNAKMLFETLPACIEELRLRDTQIGRAQRLDEMDENFADDDETLMEDVANSFMAFLSRSSEYLECLDLAENGLCDRFVASIADFLSRTYPCILKKVFLSHCLCRSASLDDLGVAMQRFNYPHWISVQLAEIPSMEQMTRDRIFMFLTQDCIETIEYVDLTPSSHVLDALGSTGSRAGSQAGDHDDDDMSFTSSNTSTTKGLLARLKLRKTTIEFLRFTLHGTIPMTAAQRRKKEEQAKMNQISELSSYMFFNDANSDEMDDEIERSRPASASAILPLGSLPL